MAWFLVVVGWWAFPTDPLFIPNRQFTDKPTDSTRKPEGKSTHGCRHHHHVGCPALGYVCVHVCVCVRGELGSPSIDRLIESGRERADHQSRPNPDPHTYSQGAGRVRPERRDRRAHRGKVSAPRACVHVCSAPLTTVDPPLTDRLTTIGTGSSRTRSAGAAAGAAGRSCRSSRRAAWTW